MIKLKSLKSKIIAGMVGLSLVTAIAIGTISVIKSSQIISNNAKEMLLISSKNKSSEIYNDLKQVEKNVILMGSLVSSASSIESKSDLEKIRNIGNAEKEYSKIRIYAKKLGENTKWCMSTYFYFDQNYTNGYDGAWYVSKNGIFTRKMVNTPITKEDGGYYWTPVETGKGMWAAPYVDPDIKMSMITYSTPVYKNGLLLGLAGMDITLDNLNRSVKNIKVYKNTEAFIVDNNFNFVAGKEFKVGDNILTAKNGMYKFLENPLRKQKSGYIEYKSKGISKILTYSTLPNGFILLINVPVSEVLSEMNSIILLLIGLIAISTVVASVIAVKIGGKISKPIQNLSKVSLRLAGNDLTVNIDEDNSSQEMMHLSSSFKKFIGNLSYLIGQISDSAIKVSSNAEGMSTASEQTATVAQQVANIANQLATGSQDQAIEINSCLKNIQDMSSSIHKISNNTEDVVKLAKGSEDNAYNGHNLAKQAVDKIKLIKETTIETAHATIKLDNLATEINIIVELIKNIATQTNLLALNASIEAARAGEHGKGFGIVAEEVKKLAKQSADATDKITAMIKQIQIESKNVSEAMVNSKNIVEDGAIIVENVGTTLEDILSAAKKVSNNSEEVAKLVNVAVINSDSISKIMENITAIVQETTASTQEMAGSTQEQTANLEEISASTQVLAQTAEDLKALVSTFKIR